MINPILANDSYKLSHADQTPGNTTETYSHLTPRGNKYLKAKLPLVEDKVIVFGLQMAVSILHSRWEEGFFNRPWSLVERETLHTLTPMLGFTSESLHRFKALHDLGYLPLRFKGIEEGTQLPLKMPVLTVVNTHPDFAWLSNFIESSLLNTIYKPFTVATIGFELAKLRNEYFNKTVDNLEGLDFALHDFSYRGHAGHDSASEAVVAYLLYTKGTDTMSAVQAAKRFYDADDETAFSIPATEHSTVTTGIQYFRKVLVEFDKGNSKYLESLLPTATLEKALFAALSVRNSMINESEDDIELAVGETVNLCRLLMDVYPDGLFSYVADSYDYNRLVTIILPALRDVITARNGTLIIRPDSADPVEVICGTLTKKGTIQTLSEVFGYTVNEKGYKVLDSHIRVVYGDGMVFTTVNNIYKGLEEQGFASNNICLAPGAYLLSHISRDDLVFAVKASHTVVDGVNIPVYKQPKTDLAKSSPAGYFNIIKESDGTFTFNANVTKEEEELGELKEFYKDGIFTRLDSFNTIKNRLPL